MTEQTTIEKTEENLASQQPVRVVLLLNNNADAEGNPFSGTVERLEYEHNLQKKLAEILPVKNRIDFQKVTRTPATGSLRAGFQEYRIACELAPNLIVTDAAQPWDSVLTQCGIPFLALNEELDKESLQVVANNLDQTQWTHPMFSRGIAPQELAEAEVLTVLADGVHRLDSDEGTVIALNPMEMFADPEPDYFINNEFMLRVPIFQEGTSVVRNKWYDTLDANALNLPFKLEVNEVAFWQKCIERRYLCRGALDLKGPYLIWSPFPQMVIEGQRIGSPAIGVIASLRQINPEAKIVYRWRNFAGYEVAATEVLEHMLLRDKFNVEIQTAEMDICEHAKPIIVHFQPYDLDLTHAGTYMAQWLMTHRSQATMETAVKGSQEMMPFITAYGFLEPNELEEAQTITVGPAHLYPA